MARQNTIQWMWSSKWFGKDKDVAHIRLEELRRSLRFPIGYVLGIHADGVQGEGKPSVQDCGAKLSGILDWDGVSDSAWGFDALDLFGVSLKEGKLHIVTYRIVPDKEIAARLCLAVNEKDMTREAFMEETSSLSSVVQVVLDRYPNNPCPLFTQRIVPFLHQEMNFECVTDYPRRLDEADRYGAIAVEYLFPALFEDAKGDVKRLTELSMLLNHAIAVNYNTSDTEMVRVYDRLWREVDEYAATSLTEKEYEYYFRITD